MSKFFIVVVTACLLTVGQPSVEVGDTPLQSLSLDSIVPLEHCTNCTQPVPVEGQNVTIWHGDGTCSWLVLQCGLDGLTVILVSPGHVTEAYLTFLGTVRPYQSRPVECTKHRNDVKRPSHFYGPSATASYVNNQCDTLVTPVGADEFFENVVNIVEFLQVDPLRDPSVFLLSHTHVTVKCCNQAQLPPANCTDIGPSNPTIDNALWDCDNKNFELVCQENVAAESYECSVKLNDSQVLGDPRLKYSIHSCQASPAGNASSVVQLVTNDGVNGPLSSAAHEVSPVCVSNSQDSPSRAIYSFSTPYFQFAEQSDDPLEIHGIAITCTVEVYEAAAKPQSVEPTCNAF